MRDLRQAPLQVRQPPPPPPFKDTTEYSQQAGDTHPTGMHICFYFNTAPRLQSEIDTVGMNANSICIM